MIHPRPTTVPSLGHLLRLSTLVNCTHDQLACALTKQYGQSIASSTGKTSQLYLSILHNERGIDDRAQLAIDGLINNSEYEQVTHTLQEMCTIYKWIATEYGDQYDARYSRATSLILLQNDTSSLELRFRFTLGFIKPSLPDIPDLDPDTYHTNESS